MMVEMVLDVMLGIMHDFVVDHLWLGELEDEHCGREDHREESQGDGLPGLQGDQGEGKGQEDGGLELQTQQEWDDDLLYEAAS